MGMRRYTDEQLLAAWKTSSSMTEVCRHIGVSVGGRSVAQVAARLSALGVHVEIRNRPRLVYDAALLAEAARSSVSIAEVVRRIGAKQTGGTQTYIGRRLRQLGIDTSHFTGQAHMRGRRSPHRLDAERVLVVLPPGSYRTKAAVLRRALVEIGRELRCARCGLAELWNGAPLRLHIDHVNGNWLDNRPGNLRFVCPNCHSQTPTYGRQRAAGREQNGPAA